MSKGQTSDAQQLKPPEEQERQIKEWVPKERLSSTVVREEIINWFAERVHDRDRTG